MLIMKRLLHKHKLIIIGVIAGAIAGYMYYYFVGCASGTCAITSSPVNSTLYFALLGGLVMNILKPEPKKEIK